MPNVYYTPQLTENKALISLQYWIKWKQDSTKIICPDCFSVKIHKIQRQLRVIFFFQLLLKWNDFFIWAISTHEDRCKAFLKNWMEKSTLLFPCEYLPFSEMKGWRETYWNILYTAIVGAVCNKVDRNLLQQGNQLSTTLKMNSLVIFT